MTVTNESTLAAVDRALAPAIKNASAQSGPLHHSEALHLLSCIRQALAHAIHGAEPEPEPELHDTYGEEQAAQLEEQRQAMRDAADGKAAPEEAEVATADQSVTEDAADLTS